MTDSTELSSADRIILFKSVVIQERWAQYDERYKSKLRRYRYLDTAWGKIGEINGNADYPTTLFPLWVFQLMQSLGQDVAKEDLPWIFRGFAERAEGMAELSSEGWAQVGTGFLIAMLHQTFESAGKNQPDPAPDYWDKVAGMYERVVSALQERSDLSTIHAEAIAFEAEILAMYRAASAASVQAANENAAADPADKAAKLAAASNAFQLSRAIKGAHAVAKVITRAAAYTPAFLRVDLALEDACDAARAAAPGMPTAAESAARKKANEALFRLLDAQISGSVQA